MPISRLRFRFAVGFAVAFLVALGLLEAALYSAVRREADRALSNALLSEARNVAHLLAGEAAERPDADRATALREGLAEVLPYGGMAAVRDAGGRLVAFQGPASLGRWLDDSAALGAGAMVTSAPSGGEHEYRVATAPLPDAQGGTVALVGRTDAMNEQLERLLRWMLATAPLVAVLSAAGGYVLSRRAVVPMRELAAAIDRLSATDRAARLPVGPNADEVDHLADRFNRLLDRLRSVERQNREFVNEAAHQIRTPLTLVLGEAELALADDADPAEAQAAMRRVHAAAAQMKHRVDGLFLLTEAGAEPSAATLEPVDLEGLVFEVTDLMRARAAGTGHALELGRIDPAMVVASDRLLREALLELLENACRHSDPGAGIVVTAAVEADGASLLVRSDGDPLPPGAIEGDLANGKGMRILEWIARQHGGRLTTAREGRANTIGIQWPAPAPGRG